MRDSLEQLEGDLPMVWHIAITNMYLHLACHPSGPEPPYGKLGSHTEEKEYARLVL